MYTLARYTVYTKLPHSIYNGIRQLNDHQGLNNNCAHLHVDSLHVLFYVVGSGRTLAQYFTHASCLGCLGNRCGHCLSKVLCVSSQASFAV